MMLNGILYWLNTGIPWRDLPERYGPWKSVYTRFRRWIQQRVWEHIFEELIAQDIVDKTTLMLDSITVKVHQHENVAKKRAKKSWDATREDRPQKSTQYYYMCWETHCGLCCRQETAMTFVMRKNCWNLLICGGNM